MSWIVCLYNLSGDDIVLKREWLKTNILDVFDHLSVRKYVIDEQNKEIQKHSKK